MSGHGHVKPNADGSKARCGGPGICVVCVRERSEAYVVALGEVSPFASGRPIVSEQAKLDAEWNAAIEAAALLVQQQFGNMNPVKVADRMRALKREVKP